MTKEQLEKIAKYNKKIDEQLETAKSDACSYTIFSSLCGGFAFSSMFAVGAGYATKDWSENETIMGLIGSILLSGAAGVLAYKAKRAFIETSNLKSRYIDSERYELEEELKNENSLENVKRL